MRKHSFFIKSASVIFAVIIIVTGCASTTMIESSEWSYRGC